MEQEQPFDAGSEKQVKKRSAKDKNIEDRDNEYLRQVLQTYEGRAFIWRLLERCKISHSAPPGEENMARFEGGRDIGAWTIKQVFTSDEKAYIVMLQEDLERKQRG